MPVEYSNPPDVPAPFGAYGNLSRAGDVVYIAGQTGARPDGSLPAADDVRGQVTQIYATIGALLESEGLGWTDVTKFVTYVTDREALEEFYKVRAELFAEWYPEGIYPPNTLLIVNGLLFPELRVEIDTYAHG